MLKSNELIYQRIEQLCKDKGITCADMLRQAGVSKSTLTELKKGRSKTLSASVSQKIASFFGVSVDYIINGTEDSESKVISNDDIKVALFGGDDEVTDEMWEEVKGFVDYVKNKYRKPPNGGGN